MTPCVEASTRPPAAVTRWSSRDRLRRVIHMLEHLRAENDVEGRIVDRQRLDRAVQIGVRILLHIHADVLGSRGEEGVVRLEPAADVEHTLSRRRCTLTMQPVRKWSTHGPAAIGA